jgi:hypothetical protein
MDDEDAPPALGLHFEPVDATQSTGELDLEFNRGGYIDGRYVQVDLRRAGVGLERGRFEEIACRVGREARDAVVAVGRDSEAQALVQLSAHVSDQRQVAGADANAAEFEVGSGRSRSQLTPRLVGKETLGQ